MAKDAKLLYECHRYALEEESTESLGKYLLTITTSFPLYCQLTAKENKKKKKKEVQS